MADRRFPRELGNLQCLPGTERFVTVISCSPFTGPQPKS